MLTSVSLPLWILLILIALSLWAILDHLLMPSVRWMLRRRANKAIDELNTRLSLKIQPFKLTKRQVLTENLLYDPEILSAVDKYAKENKMPRDVAMQEARSYASDIVPSFSAYTYFRVGTGLAKLVSKSLYRIRLGFSQDERLSGIDPNASVVFVINHRSNMDYVLVTFMVAASSALSYAVGEWARVWPIQGLIRSMGAYFVRRDSGNPLYRKVLARYVDMATKAGVVQAMFPEGGLTRDGKLRPPKLGLLSYIVGDFDPKGERDVVFVPVGVNYDRVLEDRILTSDIADKNNKNLRSRFTTRFLIHYSLHTLWLLIRGRWHRHGYACVSFGAPVSLKAYMEQRSIDFRTLNEDREREEVDTLGKHLMGAVGKVVPVLPVS
ncbi:MAG: 1-acyl-sn-glycerol-3-phosphate acyltransferase, partial [Methyloligellaceae bacterium]